MYDLTKGNYHVIRALQYPEYPESLILFDTRVVATKQKEWVTEIWISGTYNGPTDIVANTDYQVNWHVDGSKLLESGSAMLASADGKLIRQVWSSIITPKIRRGKPPRGFERFSANGQLLYATISPFAIDGQRMSYDWSGTVRDARDSGAH